jgi:hypothetical protein
MYSEAFGGASLNIKAIYVSYTPYTHSLKVILYNILNKFIHEIYSWCGTFPLHYPIGAQKVLDFGAIQILDCQVREVRPVPEFI